jgi:hypothetical protein
MPPLAALLPMIGGWAGLAKAGIGIGSALIGSKLSGAGGTNPKLNPYESNAMGQLAGISDLTGPYGAKFLSRAESAYGPAQSYWTRLLSGDRSTAMGALAPEIESLVGQTNAVRQMQGELQPRGGPGAAYMSQLPYETAGRIGGMLSQARSGAAAGLSQLGGAQGQLGLGALSAQQGAATGMLDTVLRQKYLDLYRRQMEFERARDIGRSIYGMLGGLGKGGGGGVLAFPGDYSPGDFGGAAAGIPSVPFPGGG